MLCGMKLCNYYGAVRLWTCGTAGIRSFCPLGPAALHCEGRSETAGLLDCEIVRLWGRTVVGLMTAGLRDYVPRTSETPEKHLAAAASVRPPPPLPPPPSRLHSGPAAVSPLAYRGPFRHHCRPCIPETAGPPVSAAILPAIAGAHRSVTGRRRCRQPSA